MVDILGTLAGWVRDIVCAKYYLAGLRDGLLAAAIVGVLGMLALNAMKR